MQHYNRAAIEEQLRLAVGDAVYDSLPDRRPNRPGSPRKARQRRPRILARCRLAMSGFLPPAVAAGFTTAEIAVLTIIAAEVRDRGFCALPVAEICRRATACRTSCQNAVAWAARWGLISVERRKVAADRNLPNIIRIVSPIWITWLRLRPAPARHWGGGFRTEAGSPVQVQERGTQERNQCRNPATLTDLKSPPRYAG